MKKIIISCLYVILSISMFGQDKINRVIDGDTIEIIRDNKKIKARLYGIDAPELKQLYGKESKYFLSELIGKSDKLDIQEISTDRYSRLIVVIFVDDININITMLENGYAWAYRDYLKKNDREVYIGAETKAKYLKRGLWQQDNPVAPYNYRKKNKK